MEIPNNFKTKNQFPLAHPYNLAISSASASITRIVASISSLILVCRNLAEHELGADPRQDCICLVARRFYTWD